MQKIIDENKNANQGISTTQSDIIGHAVIENTDESPALPDATDMSSLNPDKPVATSSPKAKNIEISEHHKDVPEATARPESEKQDLLLDETSKANSVISSNANPPNVVSVNPQTSDGAEEKPGTNNNVVSVNPQTSDGSDKKPGTNNNPDNKDLPDDTPSKPKRGEFRKQIVGIRRQRDPRAFKCSCCSK